MDLSATVPTSATDTSTAPIRPLPSINDDNDDEDSDHSCTSLQDVLHSALDNPFDDTIAYDVFQFYESYVDTTGPIFETKPRLPFSVEELHSASRFSVKYVCMNNLSYQ